MCVKNCLCNSCHKRNKCSDCPYIDMRDVSNNPWSIVCSTTGIQSCDYYIKPPEMHHEVKEETPTTIKFKNGSTIETIQSTIENTVRSKPKEFYFEDITGVKLYPWQRLYLRLFDTKLYRWLYQFKRR